MTDDKDQSKLSPDFNVKLKKSIKRNIIYKNILTITLLGALKSAMIIFSTIISLFAPKNSSSKNFNYDKLK